MVLVVTGVLGFRVCLVARRTGCDDCADPSVGKVVAGGTGLGSRVRTIDGNFGHVEFELNGSVISLAAAAAVTQRIRPATTTLPLPSWAAETKRVPRSVR